MNSEQSTRNCQRKKRAMRVRRRVRGTEDKPRLSINRSNKYLFVQVINDEENKTLLGVSSAKMEIKGAKKSKEAAALVGEAVSKAAKEKNISSLVLDRGSYKYHGIVAVIADKVRESGIKI